MGDSPPSPRRQGVDPGPMSPSELSYTWESPHNPHHVPGQNEASAYGDAQGGPSGGGIDEYYTSPRFSTDAPVAWRRGTAQPAASTSLRTPPSSTNSPTTSQPPTPRSLQSTSSISTNSPYSTAGLPGRTLAELRSPTASSPRSATAPYPGTPLVPRPQRTTSIPKSSPNPSELSASSLRRKAPPPLSLSKGKSRDSEGGRRRARGDSSASSEMEEEERWTGQGGSSGSNPNLERREASRDIPPPHVSSRNQSLGQDLDLGSVIPPTRMNVFPLVKSAASPSNRQADVEADGDDEAGEDDTTGKGYSFPSSYGTSPGTSNIGPVSAGPLGLPRQYNGLGLGLPFSMSAAANLSSLPSASLSPAGYNRYFPPSPGGGTARSPSGEGNSSVSGPESPVTDRSKLIGLGELATPRWTSGVLERKWGVPQNENGEKQVIRETDEDEFDIVGSYATESETAPRRTSPESSPTLNRSDRPLPPRQLYGQHYGAPPPLSSAPYSPDLKSTPGLLDFGPDELAPPTSAPRRLPSPIYTSAYATAPPPDARQDNRYAGDDVPRRYEPQRARRSIGAASSAPNTAVGDSWTLEGSSIVGLGLQYDLGGAAAAMAAADAVLQARRPSSGAASTASSRRSSTSRVLSIDGKSPTKPNHHRRQSASKSGFAHLPPSPASNSTNHTTLTGGPLIPLQLPLPASRPASQSASAARTPDHARLSHISNQVSPSTVAASILRHTRDLEFEGVGDMDALAAADAGTADALRRLDGLSSPRVSKSFSGASSATRARTSSREMVMDDLEDMRAKRRARLSTGGSSAASKDLEAFASPKLGGGGSSVGGTPVLVSSPSTPMASVPIPRSPLSPQIQQPSRTPSQSRPSSTTSDRPFIPNASPVKRGSSSLASQGAGNTTSTSGSRDSTSGTSATSLSGSSSMAAISRLATSKSPNRRGSVGSDISSIHSSSELPVRTDSRGVEAEDGLRIPPVPPIPKDWESYRPSTGGTSSSSIQQSPRLDPDRRPSQSSSLTDAALVSPQMDRTSTSSLSSKPATRKWSISFGKGKAPKSLGMKESTSFTDLLSAGQRPRPSAIPSSGLYASRTAASTSDIAGLAAQRDMGDRSTSTTSSKIRDSFRSHRTDPAPGAAMRASSTSSSTKTLSAVPPPLLVTTSPGRSRSSLLTPRRTPSGIPFFSRNKSISSLPAGIVPGGPPPPVEPPASEERSGRKSILGLNFLRGSASKKDKEKAPTSPLFQRQAAASLSAPAKEIGGVDEFGRRASLLTKSSSLITRKRGKTLPGSMEEPQVQLRTLALPPISMSALSPTTASRVESLSASTSSSSLSSIRTGIPASRIAPVNRIDSLSVKPPLPSIAGSPSSRVVPSVQDKSPREMSISPRPPKPDTPTRIPRLNQSSSGAAVSPRLTPRPGAQSSAGNEPSQAPTRRLSYASPRDTSNGSLSSSTPAGFANSFADESMSPGAASSREPGLGAGETTLSTRRRLEVEFPSIPVSRSSTAGSNPRALREPFDTAPTLLSSRASSALPRFPRRPSFAPPVEERKSVPVESLPPLPPPAEPSPQSSSTSNTPVPLVGTARKVSLKAEIPRRASAAAAIDSLSSSRSSRTLSSKLAVLARAPKPTMPSLTALPATDSGRSSLRSPQPPQVGEEELRGDEEMMLYVNRQQAKRATAGMSPEVIAKMFEFPDPTQPLPALDRDDAISLYGRYLSDYEKEEIRKYEEVYFVGTKCDKKPASKDVPLNNFGFDDERGDYLLVPHDQILYRYEVIDILGKGSFGQVMQCRDHKTGEMVAIKIIRNKKRFHHQALVEIKVLENLVKWDPDEKHFVIRMVDSFTFRGHLCIVTELLSINLYELVKANQFAGFSTVLIRRFTMQILASLSLLRHHRVVHCDLKPENILLKHPAKSAIKVIDFGSSCFEHEKVYTYIQSRFYRSPEVILGMNYHMAIDMWSLGCIIAEMYTGYPIFPGENEQEQLACIMEVMGLPDKHLVDRSSRKRLFFDSTGAPRPVVNSKGRRRRPGTKTLAQVLKSDDELFVDFIAKCLDWSPERRLKPEPALRHPWIVAGRQRAASPSVIPARTSRLSVTSSNSLSSSLPASSQISSPRRKIGAPTQSIPSFSHAHSSSMGASTSSVPTERTRTISTASAAIPPPRLTSKGSLLLPSSTSRYFLNSS